MIPTKKTTPALILAFSILLAAGAAAASPAGHWSGTVASVAGDDLALVGVSERFRLAGNVTELLSGRVLSREDLAPGSAVTLRVAAREADGRFRVDRAVVQPKNPMAIQGQITSVGIDGRSVSVLGVRVELDEHTAFSGRGASGSARSGRDLRAGMTAKVSMSATAAGTLQASEVRLMRGRGRSARVLSDRSTEPGEDQEFKGTVAAVSDTSWTIDGRTVGVDDQTSFVGAPGLGDFVEVRFHLDSEGHPIADRIQKEDAAGDELEFRGIVEAIGASSWTISGRVVAVNAQTVVTGSPRVGDLVEVRTDRAASGALTATDIHREDGLDDEREFRGTVETIGGAAWTIGGRVVLVNAATVILGTPQVGDLVEIRADRASDGTLTATRIKTEDDAGGGSGGGGSDDPPGDDNGGGSGGGSNDDPPGDDNGGGSGHGGN